MKIRSAVLCLLFMALAANISTGQQTSPVTAIKAGRLIDPETGTASPTSDGHGARRPK